MIYLHNSLRKYITVLLNFFNEMKIQYKNSDGDVVERNIPVTFSIREKSDLMDKETEKLLLSGNTNILPRAYITFDSLNRDESRMRNRNNKINVLKKHESIEYQYNSIPYTMSLNYRVICRGMTEACQLIEEVVPYFNPILNLDLNDADNEDEFTRMPILLTDTSIEREEFEEYSQNLITVNFGLSLYINIYSPVKKIENIKRYKLSFHANDERDKTYGYNVIDGYVDESSKKILDKMDALNNLQIGFKTRTLVHGDNTIYTYVKKNKLDDIKESHYTVLQQEIQITGIKANSININVPDDYHGDIEVIYDVEDAFGNKQSCSRLFNIK